MSTQVALERLVEATKRYEAARQQAEATARAREYAVIADREASARTAEAWSEVADAQHAVHAAVLGITPQELSERRYKSLLSGSF